MEKYICANCGFQGRPTKIGRVKIIKELLFWLSLRVINVFYFLWETCPKYNACPKCKQGSMTAILYMDFPSYYSIYARAYTLAFITLQKTSLQDIKSQKHILKEIATIFQFIGYPINLVLHEIESFDQLINQLILLSNSSDFEIASLCIEILNKLDIKETKQKEKIDIVIANYIESIKELSKQKEKAVQNAFGEKGLANLCIDTPIIRQALFKTSLADPSLYILVNSDIFNDYELRQIFQSLVLANREGFIKLIKHYNYNPPFELKRYVSFLIICSLYYGSINYSIIKELLNTLEKIGISKTDTEELRNSFKRLCNSQDGKYKKIIKKFIKNNLHCNSEEFLKRKPKT
ncbi:MAG: hypothetical protein WCX74_02070 [Candidatus Paceibacterota bacterium]